MIALITQLLRQCTVHMYNFATPHKTSSPALPVKGQPEVGGVDVGVGLVE